MKYSLDCEFYEGVKQRTFLGINVGRPVPTIDLLSIALVAEDGRIFYELNAEHELKYSWQDKWIRENVLLKIYNDFVGGDGKIHHPFTQSTMEWLLLVHGKTREKIKKLLGSFLGYQQHWVVGTSTGWRWEKRPDWEEPVIYADYGAYDWVLLCQLFGRMNDLPPGMPMYCYDLQQERQRLGMSSEWKKRVAPDPAIIHHAKHDAYWGKDYHKQLVLQQNQAERLRREALEQRVYDAKLLQADDISAILRDSARQLYANNGKKLFAVITKHKNMLNNTQHTLWVGYEKQVLYRMDISTSDKDENPDAQKQSLFVQNTLLRNWLKEIIKAGLIKAETDSAGLPDHIEKRPMPYIEKGTRVPAQYGQDTNVIWIV